MPWPAPSVVSTLLVRPSSLGRRSVLARDPRIWFKATLGWAGFMVREDWRDCALGLHNYQLERSLSKIFNAKGKLVVDVSVIPHCKAVDCPRWEHTPSFRGSKLILSLCCRVTCSVLSTIWATESLGPFLNKRLEDDWHELIFYSRFILWSVLYIVRDYVDAC